MSPLEQVHWLPSHNFANFFGKIQVHLLLKLAKLSLVSNLGGTLTLPNLPHLPSQPILAGKR